MWVASSLSADAGFCMTSFEFYWYRVLESVLPGF